MKTDLNKLLGEASHYKDESTRRTELLQKAYALTQSMKDLELQLEVGSDLIKAAQWSGNTLISISIFPQLLSLLDKHPEYSDDHSLLWKYKWVIMDLPDFPNITKTQIFDAVKDMEKRYLKEGHSKKVIYEYKSRVYLELGMLEEAKGFYKRATKIQTTNNMSDCKACRIYAKFKLYCHTELLETALKVGEPLFTKKHTCSSVPIGAYAYVLPFLMKSDNIKLAKKMFEKYIKEKEKDSDSYHEPILYCIKARQFTKALALLEEDTDRFLKPSSEDYSPLELSSDFYFALTYWYLCDCLQKENKGQIKIRFHRDFVLYKASNMYKVAELKHYFKDYTLTIAKVFDQRNENNFISSKITETFSY
ncbi:hypothetical protein FORMB_17720 [Formosa sp. Hel1_33_131]|jgi:tetratricopeptide (TPR) repeat protein|uniref:hypothetical protein n=1 Tax=Formosa sp. Hel1_33_131 TaxID=1336794 RepID=UPI00084E1D3F|nr:hypothetical protein [Formosa sp. Hel1_33_131]AOR28806.1 hypothetical protein FORMB_17720 [Formosa sp. Hel1_33_131]